MNPEPPGPPLTSPPLPPGDQTEQDAVAAKRKLMLLVRSRPEVLQALQLRKRADDSAIMKALGKFNNLFEILRLAGCSIPEATRAEQLWELAVQAPKARPPKRSTAWIWYSVGGIVAAWIFIFLTIIILQLTQASLGYEIGSCYISLFTNSTCLQGGSSCLMEVAVRNGELFLVKSGWSLPLEHTGTNGDFTTYFGDPFRCCNDDQGRVPNCCDLVTGGVQQRVAETFCDSWGSLGKVDWTGQPCPIGAWPCLFTVVPGGPIGDQIGELMYFARPDVSSYVIVVVSLSVILLLLILAPWLIKYCKLRCDCSFDLGQEEEAELYDPDDPKSDWGQAVQEAEEEEYRRKKAAGFGAKLLTLVPQLQRLAQLYRVLCALCRRKKSQVSDEVTEGVASTGSRPIRRSASKISQGRSGSKSHGSKSLPQASVPTGKPPILEEPASRMPQVLEVPTETSEEDEPQVAAPPVVNVSLPPGFIADGLELEGVKKYQKWDAMDKDVTAFTQTDIHPGFQLGNLSSVARLAQQQRQSLFMPIVEPIPKASAKGYTKNTLHYCSSSFRESRQKRRGKTKRPTVDGFPSKLQWMQDGKPVTGALQEKEMFRKLHGNGKARRGSPSPMLE